MAMRINQDPAIIRKSFTVHTPYDMLTQDGYRTLSDNYMEGSLPFQYTW